MGGKAGTGRKLWLSKDQDGDVWLWGRPPRFEVDCWLENNDFTTDGAWLDIESDAKVIAESVNLEPGECIELREVRRVKGEK